MASLSKSAGFLPAILITGASSGIGRQLSLEVAARNSKGCAIILTARRLQLLKELQSELQQKFKNVHVFLYALDVTDFNKTFELLDVILPRELHPLDFRLNSVYLNAGIAEISQPVGHYYDPSSGKTPAPGSSWAKILAASGIKHPEEDDGRAHFNYQKSILETNVLGLMAVTHAAMRYFIRFNVPGHLIGMSSQAGLRGLPGSSSYCTSKIAVTRFLETIGMELLSQPDNKIKVTVLNLGYIDTPLNRSVPVRPFVVPVETGVRMIVDVVEGNEKAGRTLSISSVPYWPWSLVKYLLQGLPATAVSRLVGPSYKKTDASKL